MSGGRGIARRHVRDRFVARGIERLAEGIDADDAEAVERGEELLPHERDALDQRVVRAIGGGRERAVEVVEHLDERDEHLAPAAFHVFRDFLAEPRARLLELLGGAAILREDLLKLAILRGEPVFELFDVRRLEAGLFGDRRLALA